MKVNRDSLQSKTVNDEDDEFLALDEGWWASILAEEVKYESSPTNNVEEKAQPKANACVNWDVVQGYYDRDEIINLEVHGFNRGGLLVKGDGLQGFVPVSHLVDIPAAIEETKRDPLMKEYIGKSLDLKVIECNPSQERVVLSQRAALAGEGCRKQIFSKLETGDVVCGKVTNVTDFGVFVDLGGVEGLIHVSELSWGRVRHPKEVLSIGQEIKTIVLNISEENERVALSYKRQFYNPWTNILDHYSPGDIIEATITSITRYGAFARIEEGIEGLIHVSTLALDNNQTSVNEILQPDQQVTVKILHIDVNRRRLGLGLLAAE